MRRTQSAPAAPAAFATSCELVQLLARERRAAGRADALGCARAVPRVSWKSRNSARCSSVGQVLELQAEAQVGLVGAVALHRLGVGEPRERRLELDAEHLAPERRDHPLADAEDVLLVDEGHLHVDLRELGLAVGAQVLVAQAARDLEVPVEAGDHEELLVELRRLRQRVELARVDRGSGTR